MFRSPLDHHQGARRSYHKVTTDRLLVRYTVILLPQNHSVTYWGGGGWGGG